MDMLSSNKFELIAKILFCDTSRTRNNSLLLLTKLVKSFFCFLFMFDCLGGFLVNFRSIFYNCM